MMFYEKPIALNREIHRNYRVSPVTDFSFAAKTNSIVLTAIEFIEAAKEYPIVFARVSASSVVPVALLGLRNNFNCYVDSHGKWSARYVPAYVRRYPLVLAENGGDKFTVCIDEAFAGLNQAGGQALFDAKGNNSPFLQGGLDFLNQYQTQHVLTRRFVDHLEALGLLMEISAKAELAGGEHHLIAGMLVVDEKKLLQLNAEQSHQLFTSGELGWIYAHLISLSNLGRLLDKMAAEKKVSS